MTHGLIIGKFYPPHVGHHHLIRTAAAQVDRLSVLVLGSSRESISIEDRVRWLSQIHPGPRMVVIGGRCDVPIDLHSEGVWSAHIAIMEATLQGRTRQDGAKDLAPGLAMGPVDVVFSSERYGPELARRLGATHVAVDRLRTATEVSSTAVRNDLAGSWELLHPVVGAGLTTRIVVLGAESTGTTTVSRALAESYRAQGGVWARTEWVPEYGREHTALKHEEACTHAIRSGERPLALEELEWDADDFSYIGRRQTEQEEAAALRSSPVLVCDTDALATQVWERRYLHPDFPALAHDLGPLPQRALYLLTDVMGVPFVQDGWRDGEHIREPMTGWFVEELTASSQSWALLSGSLEERLALARWLTDEALLDAANFAEPIGPGRSRSSNRAT